MSNNVSDKKSARKPDGDAAQNTTPVAAEQGGTTVHVRANGEAPKFVAPTHGGVDILKLLTELEDQIENTRKGPFGSMIGFDEDKFHMTIMKIRANLPEEMKRASKLARDQERIVEETLENSGRIKEDARKAALLDVERGKKEAAQLREQAQAEAARKREQTQAEAEREREEAQAEATRLMTEANASVDLARQAAERETRQVQSEAREQSRHMLEEARVHAAQMVDTHEIARQAQVIAQDIQLRAEEEAQAVRRGADDYARDVLINLENVLGKATQQVQRGRDMLERSR